MKVAIVYDRVNKWGGAERVLLALHKIFPDAPLYTSVFNPKTASWAKVFPKIYTSPLQLLPFAKKIHEIFAFAMPYAFESFSFDEYDLVISVTSEFAKGIITKPGTLHLSICLTPTRYLWSHKEFYFSNAFFRFFLKPVLNHLSFWDLIASKRPDRTISISKEVQTRIKKYYHLNSVLVFPPADLAKMKMKESPRDYYLFVGRLVGYKRVDLLVKTFNRLGKKLIIVGVGFQKPFLKLKAKKNIIFLENVSDTELPKFYLGAKALVIPQIEDFGLVSIEAQSLGVPVIGFRGGGSLETIIDGKTGVFFDEQSEASLSSAIAKFEKMSFNQKYLKENAQKYSFKSFEAGIKREIRKHLK